MVNVTVATSSDGDGSGVSPDAVRAADGAEVYFGWGVSPNLVTAAAKTLRWAHTAAGGVRASITPELRKTRARLTNSQGIHAEPIADWVIAAIGFWARGFGEAVAAQRECRWAKDALTHAGVHLPEMADLRVGVVGLGGIGRAVARRCAALGMKVRGIRRHPTKRRPKGVSWVGGPDDLLDLAPQSDVLVLTVPQTAETTNLVGGDVLDALPRGAYVLNVSRGALLDEAALLARLDDGHLAGCALDVFVTEPLPADHPFWNHSRVLVTPHVSAVSQRYWEREVALMTENIGRHLRGKRLKNVVDLEAGY